MSDTKELKRLCDKNTWQPKKNVKLRAPAELEAMKLAVDLGDQMAKDERERADRLEAMIDRMSGTLVDKDATIYQLRAENERLTAQNESLQHWKKNTPPLRLYEQTLAENADMREALDRLLDASDDFLALPPDDMRDFMPFGQPTTAIDCRQLIAAHHIAAAVLAKYPQVKP